LTFLGVYLITSRRARREDGDDYGDSDDGEYGIGVGDEDAEDARFRESDEANGDKRRSDGSLAFDDETTGHSHQTSRHSNGQAPPSLPQTPKRLSSTTSGSRPYTPSSLGPDSPLAENAWLSSHQPLPDTTSHPFPESQEPQESGPSTTRGPPAHPAGEHLAAPDRPAGLSRNSISRIFPGPLISPLSSSLSAIVADTLRRGVDSPTRSRRSRLGSLRLERSHRQPDGSDGAGADGAEASPPFAAGDGPAGTPAMSRSRSMSESLSAFFHLGGTSKGKAAEGADGGRAV
jgi:hypothetical protein